MYFFTTFAFLCDLGSKLRWSTQVAFFLVFLSAVCFGFAFLVRNFAAFFSWGSVCKVLTAQEGQNGCAFTNYYDFLRQADEVYEAYEAYDVTKLRRYEVTNFLDYIPLSPTPVLRFWDLFLLFCLSEALRDLHSLSTINFFCQQKFLLEFFILVLWFAFFFFHITIQALEVTVALVFKYFFLLGLGGVGTTVRP